MKTVNLLYILAMLLAFLTVTSFAYQFGQGVGEFANHVQTTFSALEGAK